MRKIQPSHLNTELNWLNEFFAYLDKTDLSRQTVIGYHQDLENFHRWFKSTMHSDVSLETLTSIDIVNYRQHLINVKRLKPATVNRRLNAIRRFCRWIKKQGLLNSDPSKDIKIVRAQSRHRPIGLKESEVHALLRVAGQSKHGNTKRNYALVQLMLQTGLRVSEVASLCIADLKIRDRSGSVRVRQGKGRKERIVPLNATARRAINRYLETRGSVEPSEPLFITGRGDAMSVRSIQSTISNLARRAKIDRLKISAHRLRHTFALNYLNQNPGKLVQLANLLGHDSLDTTAIYTQPSIEELAEDLERSPLNVY